MDVVLLLGWVSTLTIVVAGVLVVTSDLRVALGTFLAVYLGVAGLLYIAGFPGGAFTRIGLAMAAGAILWLTLVRLGWSASHHSGSALPGGRWFRLSAALLVGFGAWGLAESLSNVFPGITLAHARAASALVGFGLLQLGLSEDPIRWIFALTTCLLGFEVAYAILEPSLAVQAILACVHLGILVVGSDIAVRRQSAAGGFEPE